MGGGAVDDVAAFAAAFAAVLAVGMGLVTTMGPAVALDVLTNLYPQSQASFRGPTFALHSGQFLNGIFISRYVDCICVLSTLQAFAIP
jgi:hypothetical protein